MPGGGGKGGCGHVIWSMSVVVEPAFGLTNCVPEGDMLSSTLPAHQKVNVGDVGVSGSEVLHPVCGRMDGTCSFSAGIVSHNRQEIGVRQGEI